MVGRIVIARISMSETETKTIREANDAFRAGTEGVPGRWVLTQGVAALCEATGTTPLDVIATVRGFDTFTEDNDPYGTHDFGAFVFWDEKLFWKIDLYDNELKYGSPEPTDPSQTTRVLTIMLASEY